MLLYYKFQSIILSLGSSPTISFLKFNIERMMYIELKKVEEGILPIYENDTKEKLINVRELFYSLRGKETKTKFADWIKERLNKYKFIENIDYICFRNFTKADKYGNKTTKEYYLTIDTAKKYA